ncbi:hypothetical protein ACE1TI_20570 [Alteribacillus sp. JSM 102045]|uniref:hypothetical protein n=1 Tax=Alteribacillus sp. JSM 102045 TaxID=1562101 RepID=UPI0035BFEB5C
MKKFHYSKQAMKMMLATAIVASPLARSTPLISTPVAQAETTENDISEIAQKFFNNFYDGADGETLKDAQIETSEDIDWHYPEEIKNNTTKEDAYCGIISGISKVIFSDYSNASDLEDAINDFRKTEQKENFDEIFEDGEATTDNFIDLFREIENVLNDKKNLLSFANKSYDQAIEEIVNSVINEGNLDELEGQLNEGLGIGIVEFVELLGDFNSEIDPQGKARSELVSASISNRNLKINDLEDVKEGEPITPVFNVNFQDVADVNVAKSFNWYVINENDKETKVYSKGNGDVDFSIDLAGDYEVVAKLDRLSDSDAEIEIARTPLVVEEDRNTGGSDGSSGSGGSDSDNNDQDEGQDDNTAEPGGDSYEDERTSDEDGTERVIHRVDADKLAEDLENAENVERVSFKIEKEEGEHGELRLSSQALDVVRDKNPKAQIEVESEVGSIRLSSD